jgi:hypothetical protein
MPKSNINKLNPETNKYAVYRPIFAQVNPRNASDTTRAISAPLDCVLNVPMKPTIKSTAARDRDSKE